MKRTLFTLAALLICHSLKAQFAIGYFPFQSVVAVNSNTEKLLFADYRMETNTFLSNLNMELGAMFNIKRGSSVNYYTGAGASFNIGNIFQEIPFMNGYAATLGSRIKPLEENKNVQIIFEISPYINREFAGGNIRTRLGVAYNFTRK